MAILPAEELDGLRETAHLLRSPRNAVRLLTALQRALGTGVVRPARKDWRLDELVAGITSSNTHGEIVWGRAGREVW
jgi:antitoxin component of MazEF toxin-antitoxin module